MSWFWRLFFFGRIRRLKRIQTAAALLAGGKIEDAARLLDGNRPRMWVEDLALYHFVRGKLLMEQGELSEAELSLHTAITLGLDRPSVKLNLAVLAVRRCQLTTALVLLEEVALSDDPAILEQVKVMRRVIAETQSGNQTGEIVTRGDRFRKKYLKRIERSAAATLPALVKVLGDTKLSRSDREDACLLLGQIIVDDHQGVWLLGLEPRDHQVVARGQQWHPSDMILRLMDGDSDTLSLPPPIPQP